MPKKSDAEIVLIRFADLEQKADQTRAALEKLMEEMRKLEVMGAQHVPPAYLEAWTGALHTVAAAIEMVEGTKGIAAENALLHRALQERQLVTYPGPVARERCWNTPSPSLRRPSWSPWWWWG